MSNPCGIDFDSPPAGTVVPSSSPRFSREVNNLSPRQVELRDERMPVTESTVQFRRDGGNTSGYCSSSTVSLL